MSVLKLLDRRNLPTDPVFAMPVMTCTCKYGVGNLLRGG